MGQDKILNPSDKNLHFKQTPCFILVSAFLSCLIEPFSKVSRFFMFRELAIKVKLLKTYKKKTWEIFRLLSEKEVAYCLILFRVVSNLNSWSVINIFYERVASHQAIKTKNWEIIVMLVSHLNSFSWVFPFHIVLYRESGIHVKMLHIVKESIRTSVAGRHSMKKQENPSSRGFSIRFRI